MSTAIINALVPLWSTSPFPSGSMGPLLEELYPDIQRFTAIALKFSYHPGSPSEPRVLLIERNGKNSSWGGGTPDKEDPTIIHSTARESGEETQISRASLKDLLKMLSRVLSITKIEKPAI
ncbi:hypothetical protein N7516_011370 [Penicillium verrucosum]|uniref:uncharacterized protein n=1 Tax=Penicillium verrucosum TaxID=60171 RepID=UPI00254538CA|nr:uncharacterized protein N7516_011370 [Penicillium verrucosum]KAJ5920512.1 hypothetical protein N7516_011370 [Penicillium verrucosum]